MKDGLVCVQWLVGGGWDTTCGHVEEGESLICLGGQSFNMKKREKGRRSRGRATERFSVKKHVMHDYFQAGQEVWDLCLVRLD